MEHGFNWFKIACLVLAILLFWGIRDVLRVAPQIRQTADKVVRLNELENLDVKGKIGGCIPWDLKGSL
jgi:hypothetical protein